MPLVSPLPASADPEVAELAAFFDETLGYCPNSVLTMQRRPAIAKAFIALNKAVMENQGRVTSGLKRLIGYLASLSAGCRYCQAHTIRAAERYGETEAKLARIWDYQTDPLFTPAERAALDFAVAATAQPSAVDAALEARLRAHWDDGEIVEILGVVALFGYLNRWNDAMATTLETPAINSGQRYLAAGGWNPGKHGEDATNES